MTEHEELLMLRELAAKQNDYSGRLAHALKRVQRMGIAV